VSVDSTAGMIIAGGYWTSASIRAFPITAMRWERSKVNVQGFKRWL
jgi:hypothetical protein